MMGQNARVALVTGGNRGIGFEVCRALAQRRLRVILSARRMSDARAAAAELDDAELLVQPFELDVAREGAARACVERLQADGVEVDVLVNNAGVNPSGDLLTVSESVVRDTFDVNFFGALWCARAFVPGMIERGYGRVVNVSSGYGSFDEGLEGPAAYSLSKAALNALTLKLAREVKGDVLVNAACPGWVHTRMGGSAAPLTPAQGADTIVWLATLPCGSQNGRFFRDRAPIPW